MMVRKASALRFRHAADLIEAPGKVGGRRGFTGLTTQFVIVTSKVQSGGYYPGNLVQYQQGKWVPVHPINVLTPNGETPSVNVRYPARCVGMSADMAVMMAVVTDECCGNCGSSGGSGLAGGGGACKLGVVALYEAAVNTNGNTSYVSPQLTVQAGEMLVFVMYDDVGANSVVWNGHNLTVANNGGNTTTWYYHVVQTATSSISLGFGSPSHNLAWMAFAITGLKTFATDLIVLGNSGGSPITGVSAQPCEMAIGSLYYTANLNASGSWTNGFTDTAQSEYQNGYYIDAAFLAVANAGTITVGNTAIGAGILNLVTFY